MTAAGICLFRQVLDAGLRFPTSNYTFWVISKAPVRAYIICYLFS